ncbi:ribonuclease H-like domain-containing protein [Tanacetum coccineum]
MICDLYWNISSDASDEASDPSVDKSLHQGAKKRVRGPTKKKEIWNLASDEKVLVTFNELCQPIGDEGNELTNFLGTLVRMPQHIGIHYPEWRKEKFSFQSDHSEKDIKEWIMSDMSTKWKCWKYELKKSSYDPTMTINEIVASQTDDRVETGQFRTLVESWFTEEKQVESERKKINRLKSIEPHVTGTKSFARVKDEEVKYLRQGFMMFAAAVQEQVPNLNLSSVMNFMNMEVDDLSSIHDNTTGKNPSSASGTQNSHFRVLVHDTHPNKSDANQHHTSVLPVKESTVQKSALKKPGGIRHHTSGKKSAVRDTLNKSSTSRFNTSVAIGKEKVVLKCLEAL